MSYPSERRVGRNNKGGKHGKGQRGRGRDDSNVVDFNDAQARREGPTKKTWHEHDLRHIRGMTENQEIAIEAYLATDDGHLSLLGSAGTGKTLLALYLAFVSYTRGEAEGVTVVRASVPKRDPGALPGTLEQKQAPYEAPYRSLLHFLFGRASTYDDMKEAGVIEYKSTSYLRGTTIDNRIILVEEGQNLDFDEIDSVLTRAGTGSRVILTGDTLRQCDLKHFEVSGIQILQQVKDRLEGMTIVEFGPQDCVRSGFAKSWLLATEEFFTEQRLRERLDRH
jgi:phosphate starvation-inducible PhoH-like protein